MKLIDSSPAELRPDQLRVAKLFASMDEQTQQQILLILEGFAERYPRHSAPALRLVKGGSA
ncbi:hypothetical protein [Duganella callida]|uniref:Uncharacterized protein n=1 Tax=Duganella callida TaxID=2561932 RepID=A0A4Y9RVE8_9BURK|nr:hypothetical protein [Duganella callida]TFW13277.1 hypothetical protein E4L98_29180 [Duganella callida]